MSTNIIDELASYSKAEKNYSEELMKLANEIRHPVLKTLFESIAKDSDKHSMIYASICELLTTTQPFITENEYRAIANVIDRHIKMEEEMLKAANRIFSSVDDPRVKLLIAAIREDEAKHHALLIAIKNNIARKEVLREEDFWDLVWRESPWHGAPGG
ncbi:MAG: ferritin-like domain-containing protein [Desulfurococcaceae archaeon]